jgi:hypothetical protein
MSGSGGELQMFRRQERFPNTSLFRRAAAAGMVVILLVSTATTGLVQSQEIRPVTPEVFRQFSDRVIKIQVVETGSAAKANIGTGFFVTPRGDIVTNYHVISKLIHTPDRYRVETVDVRGEARPVAVLAVDVIYDLAILRSEERPQKYFSLGPAPVSQGARLYSLGHPRDLGLSIVEGTYNGLLQHSLYPKIHLTSPLDVGMSGGPTLTEDGRVVGVNVSSGGNQISFLVPVERAIGMLAKTSARGFRIPAPDTLLSEVGRQIHAYQAQYLADVFSSATPKVSLGPYELPTKPTPVFKCWADAMRKKELPYQVVDHQCSTDDYVFVSSQHSSGLVGLHHQLISSGELNPLQFFALYSNSFQGGAYMYGDEGEVTPFRCETRNVKNKSLKLRAALCVRQYVKLQDLYDAVLKVAILGSQDAGLVTTLTLSGASFENVQQVTRRYLENIEWQE